MTKNFGEIVASDKGKEFLSRFEAFERINLALRPQNSTEQDDETCIEFRYRALGMNETENEKLVLMRYWESMLFKMKRKNPDASDDDLFYWFRLLLSGDWTIADVEKGIARSTIYPDIDWDVDKMRPK